MTGRLRPHRSWMDPEVMKHPGATLRSGLRCAKISEARSSEIGVTMTTAVLEPRTYPFDVEDIEYLRHGDKPLLARVFRPRGEGPFPALVECHGGAWCLSDRTTERLRHEAMAKNGIVTGLAWTD